MSNGPCAIESADAGDVTVLFGERFQASQKFDQVFRQGMGLVEEAAAYLDGAGRKDAKALSEAFFSQLGPNSNFGSQFAQTVKVKCSDAHL